MDPNLLVSYFAFYAFNLTLTLIKNKIPSAAHQHLCWIILIEMELISSLYVFTKLPHNF